MRSFILISLITGLSLIVQAQDNTIAQQPVEMKQYFFVMLSGGSNRNQDSATAAQIQRGHMDNIGRLAKEGKLIVAGPFGDEGKWKGIFIFDAPNKEEVIQMLNSDPAISSGRLIYEIHPWWTAKNCVFK